MRKVLLLWLISPVMAWAQHHSEIIVLEPKASEKIHQHVQDPHHHRHPLRAALLIGHGMLPEPDRSGILFVPSWGLDLDYHLSDNWSLGWHSDVELENYVVIDAHGEAIELITPLVSTLDVFYRLNHNLLLGVGPGFTKEEGDFKALFRVGIEGEVPLNDRWEWTPTLFMDRRFDGHTVWTVALGVAHYL